MGDNAESVGSKKSSDNLLLLLTDYWRRVQVATALESLKDEKDGSGDEERAENIIRGSFSQEQFEKGACPQSVWMRAFKRLDDRRREAHEKALRWNPRAVMPEPVASISVVFSPFGVRVEGERDPVYVVFGTASVDRHGVMSTAEVDSDLPPIWIGRSCLSPTDGLEDDVFPLTEADIYYNEIGAELQQLGTWPSEWGSILSVCEKIWRKTGTQAFPLFDALSKRYAVTDGWLRFEEKDSKKLTIIRMYEKIRERVENGAAELLYREAVLGRHRRIFTHPRGELHLGQMGSEYPLAPSQRSSLLAYLQTPNGCLTAVNGPPGTGKTTLLQSVVATEMVSRAIGHSEAPLFIAGAATNQAVFNIIKAFREATEKLDHPLADRWIPGLGRRYGVYFRGSKGEGLNLAKGSLICVPSSFGGHKTYKDEDIKQKVSEIEEKNKAEEEVGIDLFLPLGESEIARKHFMQQASRLLEGDLETLESVKAHLHSRLKNVHEKVVVYSREADKLTALVAGLKLHDYATYDDAIEVVAERQQRAQAKLQALTTKHEAEHASDKLRDSDQRRVEDSELQKLANSQDNLEKQESENEKLAKANIFAQVKLFEEARKRYNGLGEPTTFWCWFGERFFPWIKNSQMAKLKELVSWMEDNNLGSSRHDDIPSMRQHVEKTIGLGPILNEKIRKIDADALARRDGFQKKKSTFVSAINEKRRKREVELQEREAARITEQQMAGLALKDELRAYDDLRAGYANYQRTCWKILAEEAPREFDKVAGKIDTTLRVEAFLLATHYWECRFLLEVEKSGWRAQLNRREAFRVIAMLTPCFVSTFDKMGTAFNIMKHNVVHPMWGFADTLVVDEAGQASPDKGAFAFSLAKKAIVVGDNLQLPPVNSTDSGTILTSIARCVGILENKSVTSRGLLTGKIGNQQVDGSLMRMASAAAYFDMSASTQGMWLRDHFRCDPRIIQFCNRIWYTGETSLVPRRVRDKESFVPHFGHVNVVGKATNKSNEAEANAIMVWLNLHGEELQRHYGGKPLHEIVAVLTQFSNQRNVLRRHRDRFAWSSTYELPGKMVMGTVHALQGAEREVVLFSTVYDQVKPMYFFDREHTLLNVAVSRAKDSFIVFGNRLIFHKGRPDPSRPSTLLQEHLLDELLSDVPPLPEKSPHELAEVPATFTRSVSEIGRN